MNFKISTVLSAQFAGMPLYSLFQGIGFRVLGVVRQFADVVKLCRRFFTFVSIPVKRGGFSSCFRVVSDCKQFSDAVPPLNFMDIGLVLACESFVHTVFHHISKSADFESVIGNGIIVVQTSDLSVIRRQNLDLVNPIV